MISALPGLCARTIPEELTEATVVSVERHCTRPRSFPVALTRDQDQERVGVVRAHGELAAREGEISLGHVHRQRRHQSVSAGDLHDRTAWSHPANHARRYRPRRLPA